MASVKEELNKTRNELKNIRQMITTLKHVHKKDVEMLKGLLAARQKEDETNSNKKPNDHPSSAEIDIEEHTKLGVEKWKPIGHMQSVFKHKNGTPRQANVCEESKATLQLRKGVFTNPEHSLEGLDQYSHVWVIYEFHKNNTSTFSKAKVKPPRLDGVKVGLFSTRCPYRPNPVGLSLVKLDGVEGSCLHFSGVDILDGTPVIDIKPYIPTYDLPGNTSASLSIAKLAEKQPPAADNVESPVSADVVSPDATANTSEMDTSQSLDVSHVLNEPTNLRYAKWINSPPIRKLSVNFAARAETDLESIELGSRSKDEARQMIESILGADPRSAYRRQNCQDRLYYFTVDHLHVTSWFDDDIVEVLRIKVQDTK